MSVKQTYDRIAEGVAFESEDAGIRFTTQFDPSGGPGTRVMPPTYPGGYLRSRRHVGREEAAETVLLDSVQSQANRIEEALLEARDDGRVDLPLFELSMQVADWPVRLTSLDLPHRFADAYLRDSSIDGTKFDETEIGRALRVATPENASAVYRYDPGSLIFGAWNSHRKGRQPKFARAYKSEVLGIGELEATRMGGRLDPMNLTGGVALREDGEWDFVVAQKAKKAKGEKLSEIGHGNALSGQDTPGGVTVEEVRRIGFLSFAALGRIRFPDVDPDGQRAGRVALAALALVGDRLAFDRPGLVYRSGCELTVRIDLLAWEQRGGATEELDLGVPQALELLAHARAEAERAGLVMEADTIEIEPTAGLRDAIEHSFLAAESEE